MALETELEVFRMRLPGLLEHEGKYALICGNDVSIFETRDEALAAGYDRFELKPFLVKKIVEHETPLHFSRRVTRCP
jgi:hypothetical protein